MSQADELLKLKELLDSGILTQEEFNKKKDEILENTPKKDIEESITKEKDVKVESNSFESNRNNSDEKKKKSKHIGWWIAFIIFALGTIGGLSNGTFISISCDIAICLVCLPPFIDWLESKNYKFSTGLRIIIIIIIMILSGLNTSKDYLKNTSQKQNDDASISVNTNQNENTNQNPVFVPGTSGKAFYEIILGNTNLKGQDPIKLNADNMIPYDTLTYNGPMDDKYSFDVTTNTNDEISNVQLYFYNYGKEDPTNYFMVATRLDYPTKDVAQLTDFISKNIGKDEKITIGDFSFHLFNGTSNNCVILDIYTEEWAKINGNQ